MNNMNNFEIAKNHIGEGMLVQNFKANVWNQALKTLYYLKMSPKCHSLLTMVVTGHEKSFVLT